MTPQSHTLLLVVQRSARRVLFSLETREGAVVLPVSEWDDLQAFVDDLADWLRTSGATVVVEEET